jgi:hypothetical protein
MRYISSKLALLLLCCASIALAQTQINPTTQIRWPLATGGVDPVTPTQPCVAANYGQPYTNTTTGRVFTCAVSGWTAVSVGGAVFPSSTGVVFNTSTMASRNAVSGDIATLWTGTGCGTATNVPQLNGNCTPASGGGGGSGPAGAVTDVQFNLDGTNFGADPGNFTYVAGTTHQLSLVNQTMSGLFSQTTGNLVDGNFSSMSIQNVSSTAPPTGGSNGAATFIGTNYGPGQNISGIWRVATAVTVNLGAFSSGIAQGIHVTPLHFGTGDSAAIYVGNAEGFSPCMWTTGADEGCVGLNINGIQFLGFASGTLSSTTGTGDRAPLFSITPVNLSGANNLISEGIIEDTSVTLLHTSLTGSVSSRWETNPLLLGSLPVASATPSTGICITTADIPGSTVLDVYQTKTFNCTTHDALPVTTGHVWIASGDVPEQADIITYNSGTGVGTISVAKPHATGSYIFQGGTQGFIDFDDDITTLGLHSAVYSFGGADSTHLIIGQRQAGSIGGQGIPYVDREPAGLTLTGGVTVHPGAMCNITNSNNTACTLESNTVAWSVGHTFAAPTGLPTVQIGVNVGDTQSSPDSPQSPGFGIGVTFGSSTNHSSHAFFSGFNAASLSKYKNSGLGTGWLTAPPAIDIQGPTGNILQFSMALAGDGLSPCGGGNVICYTDGMHSSADLGLFRDGENSESIVISPSTHQFVFNSFALIDPNITTGVGGVMSTSNFQFIDNTGVIPTQFHNAGVRSLLSGAPSYDRNIPAPTVNVGTTGSTPYIYWIQIQTSTGTTWSQIAIVTNGAATPNNTVLCSIIPSDTIAATVWRNFNTFWSVVGPSPNQCSTNPSNSVTDTGTYSGTVTATEALRAAGNLISGAFTASSTGFLGLSQLDNFNDAGDPRLATVRFSQPTQGTFSADTITNGNHLANMLLNNFTVFGSAGFNAITNAAGLQVVTGSGCTTAASLMAPCNVTMALAVAEPNTSYTIQGCTMNGAAAVLGNASSLTTTNFVLAEYSATASAATGGTITCNVIHN